MNMKTDTVCQHLLFFTVDLFNSFTAAGDFSRHENHIDTRNSAVKELIDLC